MPEILEETNEKPVEPVKPVSAFKRLTTALVTAGTGMTLLAGSIIYDATHDPVKPAFAGAKHELREDARLDSANKAVAPIMVRDQIAIHLDSAVYPGSVLRVPVYRGQGDGVHDTLMYEVVCPINEELYPSGDTTLKAIVYVQWYKAVPTAPAKAIEPDTSKATVEIDP